jgi:hypothetical protein
MCSQTRRQRNFAAIETRTTHGQAFSPRLGISAFNRLELLHQAYSRVGSFSQCELFYAQKKNQ